MSPKHGRSGILIACACAIFWPGFFVFGYPGVMRQYWQQTFNVGGSDVGRTIFFIPLVIYGAYLVWKLPESFQDELASKIQGKRDEKQPEVF